MPAFTQKLSSLLTTSSSTSSASSSSPASPLTSPNLKGIDKDCAPLRMPSFKKKVAKSTVDSQPPWQPTACSSQLFGMIKALAGNKEEEIMDDLDTDEDVSLPPAVVKSEEEQKAELGRWMSETMGKTLRERDTMSSRFAALSMSNLSPLAQPTGPRKAKSRPALPRFDPDLELTAAPDQMDPEEDQPSEATTPSIPSPGAKPSLTADFIPDEEKVQVIIEEFGDIASLVEDGEPERLLAESMGSLFKGVMMVGNLHLTTHRLLFHALLPPESAIAYNNRTSGDIAADAAFSAAAHQPDVLQGGPVTVHRPGIFKSRNRVWMELSAEMVTTYPSADEAGRVRPLKSILLSSVRNMEPFDPEHPCDFHVSYETATGIRESHFTVDTEQSASEWRRQFDGALFRHSRARWRRRHQTGESDLNKDAKDNDEWTMMRCCIPLDRADIEGVSDFHTFATLVGLIISLDDDQQIHWRAERASEVDVFGDAPKVIEKPRRTHTNGLPFKLFPSASRDSSPDRRDSSPSRRDSNQFEPKIITHDDHKFIFNVAVLNEQSWFAKALDAAVKSSANRKYKPGVARPKMVLEIAGNDCLATDEDLESPRSSADDDEVDDEDGTPRIAEARKAEKASLAAKMFGLNEEDGIYLKRCYVSHGLVPARGHIILTPKFICFWRRANVGADIKYRFKTSDIKGAVTCPGIRARFHGMALQIHGKHDLRFEFWQQASRDSVLTRINDLCSPSAPTRPFVSPTSSTSPSMLTTASEKAHAADVLAPPPEALLRAVAFPDGALSHLPFVANKPMGARVKLTPRTFTCLTIGSRGDVQPYIALGLRLMKDGHKVVIVTHEEFKGWIEGYGIEHRQAGGDPTALMKLSQEHKMFSPGFFKESLGSFRQWLDELLNDAWEACKDADVLIESPSTMAGVHIAEALKIPYFRAFTMPWTRTTAYPHAFMVPAFEMGPSFNYSTYVLFDNIMWQATSGQINKWRKTQLNLKSTDMSALSVQKIPFLYNFSSAVVPKPLDWHDDIDITGYWNLEDSDTEWTPPKDLELFIAQAKEDGKALVYIGFGSIVVPRPNAMTKSIIKAVEKADVRAIIAKGWSSRSADQSESVEFPPSCYSVDKIPHGWLFPKVAAALHHGGAGTVGASLRAGVPTLIKPWFGDQYFWALRVTKLEVGIKISSLRSDEIAAALVKATTDKTMIEKAARVGERIRSENGVDNAMRAIHFNIGRAASDRTKMQWAK